PDNVCESCEERFASVLDIVFLTQLHHQGADLVEVCSGHNLLMFYLVVEVTGEPIVKDTRLYIAGCLELHGEPVHGLCVSRDVVGKVTHLGDPREPVALDKSEKE
ncbi:hypothetical protein EGW08_001097, partial [Elysia chlorotica]